ncbi:hypothetical protein QBZ16_002704 [Prototheca wickerhamii]|uniref:Uncharacterized protein n=1 Tax=Prototheca wickerhamii TaxID=3111 RepID=A0AAD9IKT9_PROWI|nr:hypothetical protein QBZ16_002704 [Prototheca wickerhamii]
MNPATWVDGDLHGKGPVEELMYSNQDNIEIHVCMTPTLEGLPEYLAAKQPNILYVMGGILHAVYLDAAETEEAGQRVRQLGIPYVIHWRTSPRPLAVPAMHFARAFFAGLRRSGLSVAEAFGLASHSTRIGVGVPGVEPALPVLLAASPACLPGPASAFSLELAVVPELAELRLLAPAAEALRGLLTAEARGAVLAEPPTRLERAPASAPCLPSGAPPAAARLRVLTTSGGPLSLVLTGTAAVFDSHAGLLKLAPGAAPAHRPRVVSPAVAGGAAVVELLALGSLWMVAALKALAEAPSYRGLVALGIGAVAGAPVAAFGPADGARWGVAAAVPAALARHQQAAALVAAAQQRQESSPPSGAAALTPLAPSALGRLAPAQGARPRPAERASSPPWAPAQGEASLLARAGRAPPQQPPPAAGSATTGGLLGPAPDAAVIVGRAAAGGQTPQEGPSVDTIEAPEEAAPSREAPGSDSQGDAEVDLSARSGASYCGPEGEGSSAQGRPAPASSEETQDAAPARAPPRQALEETFSDSDAARGAIQATSPY